MVCWPGREVGMEVGRFAEGKVVRSGDGRLFSDAFFRKRGSVRTGSIKYK